MSIVGCEVVNCQAKVNWIRFPYSDYLIIRPSLLFHCVVNGVKERFVQI